MRFKPSEILNKSVLMFIPSFYIEFLARTVKVGLGRQNKLTLFLINALGLLKEYHTTVT